MVDFKRKLIGLNRDMKPVWRLYNPSQRPILPGQFVTRETPKRCKDCTLHANPDENGLAYCRKIRIHIYVNSLACVHYDDEIPF